MVDVQEQMDRVNTFRKKAEEVDREKSRVSGELGTHKKRQEELAGKCKEEFDCKVDEIPKLVDDLMDVSTKSLEQAEIVLGLKEGKVEPEKKPEPKSEPEPVEVR